MKINETDRKGNIRYLKENYGKNILPLSLFQNKFIPGSEPLEILFFWKKESTYEEGKESLLKAIKYYNLFSSCLIMIDDNKFALQYCEDGVKINYLPPINATFEKVDIDDIKKMMIHVKTLPGEPLLAVTFMPVKGGRFVGISCSDAVADVFSLILFLFAWKSIIEGSSDFPLPSPQRLFKGKPMSSDRIKKDFIPSLSELNNEIKNRVKSNEIKTYTKKEYFPNELLNEIKNKVRSENEKYNISDSQIITSYLLKKYHRQVLPDADNVILRNPINLRDVHPDIDLLYIGNAFFDNITLFTKDEINEMSIFQIARCLKESISNMCNEKYVKKISYLSEYGIEFKTDLIKNYFFYNVDTDIVSSNLIHLDDPKSLGLSSDLVNILHISAARTSFIV